MNEQAPTDLFRSIHSTNLHLSNLREPPTSDVLSTLCDSLPIPFKVLESDDPAFLLELEIFLALDSDSDNDPCYSQPTQTREEEIGIVVAGDLDD